MVTLGHDEDLVSAGNEHEFERFAVMILLTVTNFPSNTSKKVLREF